MAITATTIIFVIEASVKLGRKVYDVAVDETVKRPLYLPPGEGLAGINHARAIAYFSIHPELVSNGGPYEDIYLDDDKITAAYEALVAIEKGYKNDDVSTSDVIDEVTAFRQFVKGEGPKSPLQRIAGTLLEIGVDYFVANPQALSKDSDAKKVISAFFVSVKDIEFAEGDPHDILRDVLKASLSVLGDHTDIIIGEKKLQPLLGGVSNALLEDFDGLGEDLLKKDNRRVFYRRFGSTLMRGAAKGIAEDPSLWIEDAGAQEIVKTTMVEILDGVAGRKDLFTEKTLEVIVQSTFSALSQHASLFGNNALLKEILQGSGKVLSKKEFKDYGPDLAGQLLAISIETVGNNASSFIHGKGGAPLASVAVKSVSLQLAGLLKVGAVKDVFTANSVRTMFQMLLLEVAKDPELLLGTVAADSKKSVLAKIMAAVASAFGQADLQTIDDNFMRDLVYVCIRITVRNADTLLGTASLPPGETLICKGIQAYMTALFAPEARRPAWPKEVFVQGAEGFLGALSTHLRDADQLENAQLAIIVVCEFSGKALDGKINGNNFPVILADTVVEVLQGTLVGKEQISEAVKAAVQ